MAVVIGRRRALLVLLWLGVCGPLLAQTDGDPYELGLAAYRAGRYDEAAGAWGPLAEAGNALAQFSMGTLCHDGRGMPKDDVAATRWFRLSAEQGYPAAQYNLGNAYKHGRGIAPSDAEAVAWWRRAADQGMASAQFNLGTAYRYGDGVPPDDEEALRWYQRAAENGHPQGKQIVAEVERARAGAAAPVDSAAGTPPAPAVSLPAPPPARPAASPPRADPAAPPAAARVAPAPAGSARAGHAWVQAQDPDHFTVQIISSPSEAAVREHLRRHPLPGVTATYPYRQGGIDRFALLYGTFPDRAKASEALRGLPEDHRRSSPWVRSFRELRALGAATAGR